jgi:hypothetical protein
MSDKNNPNILIYHGRRDRLVQPWLGQQTKLRSEDLKK